MDFQEQINTLTSEKNLLTNALEVANAEKMALDVAYVNALKENINSKKELILLNNKFTIKEKQCNDLIRDVIELKKKIEELEEKIFIKDNPQLI